LYFIEAVKNLYSYLFLGRCRRHNRELSVVQVRDHYASTMPVCIECHPHYRDCVVVEAAQPLAPDLREERNWLDIIAFPS
jgi:hypothetical protein